MMLQRCKMKVKKEEIYLENTPVLHLKLQASLDMDYTNDAQCHDFPITKEVHTQT